MNSRRHFCPAGLRAFQPGAAASNRDRLRSQDRLREVVRAEGSRLRVICAHDPAEFHPCVASG